MPKDKSKKTNFSEYVERCLDCPHCGFRICDDSDSPVIFENTTIKCPSCDKVIRVGHLVSFFSRNLIGIFEHNLIGIFESMVLAIFVGLGPAVMVSGPTE